MPVKIQYGTRLLSFEIERKERKTLAIEVYPDLTINVLAPPQVTIEEIKERVLKRASWIVKQRNYFDQFLPRMPKKEYIAGESHLYLGRKYVLKIIHSAEESVKLKGGNIIILSKTGLNDNERARILLAQWYRAHAMSTFERTLNQSLNHFKKFDLKTPELQVKRMKSRWGSCTPSGRLILNPEIIKAPSKCVEYIIVHELCHLVHSNHSKHFYSLLVSIMPDWKRWKLRLEKTEI